MYKKGDRSDCMVRKSVGKNRTSSGLSMQSGADVEKNKIIPVEIRGQINPDNFFR